MKPNATFESPNQVQHHERAPLNLEKFAQPVQALLVSALVLTSGTVSAQELTNIRLFGGPQEKAKAVLSELAHLSWLVDSTVSANMDGASLPPRPGDITQAITETEAHLQTEAALLKDLISHNHDLFLSLCEGKEDQLARVLKILTSLADGDPKGIKIYANPGGEHSMSTAANPLNAFVMNLTLPTSRRVIAHELLHAFSLSHKPDRLAPDLQTWYQPFALNAPLDDTILDRYINTIGSLAWGNQIIAIQAMLRFYQSEKFTELPDRLQRVFLKELFDLWDSAYLPGTIFENNSASTLAPLAQLLFDTPISDPRDNPDLYQYFQTAMAANRSETERFTREYYGNPNEVFAFGYELWRGYRAARTDHPDLTIEDHILEMMSHPDWLSLVAFLTVQEILITTPEGTKAVDAQRAVQLIQFFETNFLPNGDDMQRYFGPFDE